MKNFDIIVFIAIFWLPFSSLAQNYTAQHDVDIEIPEIALLGLISENKTGIELTTASPAEAGNTVDVSVASDNNIWINYSSVISGQTHKRKVIAVLEGDMPSGMHLLVRASEATGYGNGNLGEPAGSVRLSQQPNDVILNIGSCYTGKGLRNGHYLTYQLEYDESESQFAELTHRKTFVNVVYTLTDSN